MGGCCHVVFSEYKLILLTDFHGLSQKLEGTNISKIPFWPYKSLKLVQNKITLLKEKHDKYISKVLNDNF